MDQSEIRKFYNGWVGRQEEMSINKRHLQILKYLVQNGLRNTSNLLEIGCGIGTVTELIAKECENLKITAIDLSDESINKAREKLRDYDNLYLVAADIIEYEFNELFDFILLPDVIEHIPIHLHDKLFAKISSLLNVNGKIFINIPDPEYLTHLHQVCPEKLQIIDQPIQLDHLYQISSQNNLTITYFEKYSLWINGYDYNFIILHHKPDENKFEERAITISPVSRIKNFFSLLKGKLSL